MTLEQLIALGLSEEIAKKVLEAYQATLKDRFVPIERFNEINEVKNQLDASLKERDKQLQELKDKAKGNDELTEQIRQLQQQNDEAKGEYEKKIAELKKSTAIEMYLVSQKAKNIKAAKALLDLEKISLDGDNIIGIEDQVKGLKEKESYLFGEDKLSGRDPHKDTEPVDPLMKKNPFSKEHFNLTEQGRLYREDPELAKKLKEMAK